MPEIEIKIPTLHASQEQVLKESKRFNVLKNGRRWGKTTLAVYLAMQKIIDGFPVGYWSPIYKDLNQIWEEIVYRCEPITLKKNEQTKELTLITSNEFIAENGEIIRTQGKFECWSMDSINGGRGRKYKLAIIDEAAQTSYLEECFSRTIRPTLIDLRGDAWIISTPKGKKSFFQQLYERKDKRQNWMSWQKATMENPYISKQEIEEFQQDLDTFTFRQEILGESIDHSAHAWAYAFNEEKHTGLTELNIAEPLFISFDFNHSPRTCTVWQHYENKIRCLTEFDSNYGLIDLCGKIKDYIGEENGELKRQVFITGDMSGWARSALVEGNRTAYDIISGELYLTKYQIQAPKSNPNHTKSRELVNSMLERHPDFLIDKINCPKTIYDLKFAESTDTNDIVKDRKTQEGKADFLDAFAYYLNTYHQKFIRA